MSQTVGPLTPDDAADLEAKRDWVRNHYDEGARHQYGTLEGKLRLVDTILVNGWVAPDEALKLQCLGVAFGDALSQLVGLSWVAVEDEHGRDPALMLPGTSILVFPLTSISKRVENGEAVDVYTLLENACNAIERARKEGGR